LENSHFSFEDLEVWQKAVEFADNVIKHYRLIEQLESAVTSVAMNIAEGKGRFSKKEFIQYLYIARGSLFETVTLMEIFKRRNWIDEDQYITTRKEGTEIGKMLSGL